MRSIYYGILQPVLKFLKSELSAFFQSQKPKFTSGYWKDKWQRLKHFNWRKPTSGDYLFLFKGILKVGLFLLLLFFLFYTAVFMGAFGHMPSRAELESKQNNTASEVYSADSVLLGRYYLQDRTNVDYEDIAPAAIHALVATEDVRFYDHGGIDYRSLARVLVKTLLLQNESSGGGSTLSQQIAKNLYPRRDYWIWDMPVNKLREMIIARRLEGIFTKEEILELYLNTVPMGGNLYGIQRSSRRFFNTSPDSLKTEEAAVLIGMLKATTTYNPRLNLERSRQRRNVVLGQMAKYGYLTAAEADSLKQLPLKLNYNYTTHNDGLAPYFREQLRQELMAWAARQKKRNGEPYNLYTDGLIIYTTIDAGMQEHAERAVRRRMSRLQKQFDAHWKNSAPWGNDASVIQDAMRRSARYIKLKEAGMSEGEIVTEFKKTRPMNVFSWSGNSVKNMSPMDSLAYYRRYLNTGLLSMDPSTGYVKAWVGGINHTFFKYDHVRSNRQVGSTFKPIVYAAALEKGIAPCTYFPNQQVTYEAYDGWTPRNSNGQYGGEYTMRGALAHSVNTISAQVLMQTGIDRTVSLAQRMGIESDLPAVPSLALGTASLSLYEMVSAYATFANEGRQVTPVYITKIADQTGRVLLQHRTVHEGRRVLSDDNAAIMLHLMQGVVEEGSAARLRSEFGLKMDIAGKTGTTQNHSDGWFIGITSKLVTGVWVGAESPKVRFRTLALGQGSNTALPIWGDYTRSIALDKDYVGYINSQFPPLPNNLQNKLDCPSFREEPPKKDFFERIIDGVTDKAVEIFEGWNENRKQRREERRRRRQNN
ncbi:penicillin-binding protein 1A [Pontibacter harenae]|uniref:penicillin-binding protein 1A n=1 Tax=Pontibacter harenae TaxID=2894083 RepID=UPI001E28EC9D|nr:transglycosylase domain-containing protein [Pontibacter harenae]MCC9166946.1 transglycosylase domain-containing protein [Pontibacter harenae]